MSRLSERFAACRRQGRAALVTYLAAGDPDLATTANLVRAAERGGADVLELGIPFSDPLADGSVIQAAYNRALAGGASAAGVLACVNRIRSRSQLPIVLMGALNPVMAYGIERFCHDAAGAGADGLLIGDLLPEDAGDLLEAMDDSGLASVFLATPDTTGPRLQAAARASTGFLYMVSRRGVTGSVGGVGATLEQAVDRARAVATVPVCVGFGISSPIEAMRVARAADGVIVGSALVEIVHEAFRSAGPAAAEQALERAVAELAEAIAAASTSDADRRAGNRKVEQPMNGERS